jgi:hypothetical protein
MRLWEVQSKCSRDSLTSTVWRTSSSYRLDTWLLAASKRVAITSGEKSFLSSPTTVFGYPSEWLLAVPCSETEPQGDTFHNHGGHQTEWTTELRKIPKEAFRLCFQQRQDRWSKCVCAQGSYFESDYVSVAVCTTITEQYHYSGNFFIAHRTSH